MEPMYVATEIWRNILNYVDFSKKCYVIKSFSEFCLEKKILLSLYPQVQEQMCGKINILDN